MGKRRRKPVSHSDPDLREVKYILIGVSLVFLLYFVAFPVLSQPSMFIIPEAYAEDQRIYIAPDNNSPAHTGTGATCPTITGPSSGTDTGGNTITHFDSASASGCRFNSWTTDRTTTTQTLLPEFFNDFLTQIHLVHSQTSTSFFDNTCRGYAVSSLGHDPRLNITGAYEAIQDRTTQIAGNFEQCDGGVGRTNVATGSLSDFLDSMALNNTFYSYSITPRTDDRFGTNTLSANSLIGFSFTNPTQLNNTVWMMQEHPKFVNSDLEGGFFGIDDTTFTMDSNSLDDTEVGQVIVFKEFDVADINGTGLRITGGFEALGSSSDQWLRIEVKDGSYGTQQLGSFPEFDYDIYQEGGSLGVLHLEPDTPGIVTDFDITLDPNWLNALSNTVTLFIGVDDNSTAGSTIVNITSVEWDSVVKYDFDDINTLDFYETSVVEVLGVLSQYDDIRPSFNDYDAGILNVTNVTTSGFSAELPPEPNPATNLSVSLSHFDEILVEWSHDNLNVTNFLIERDDGSGYIEIVETLNPLIHNFTDAEQLNFTRAAVNSLKDAVGLEPNTTYTYRVTALNGGIESTPVTSSSITTPDDLDFFEIKEHDAETLNSFPDVTVGTAGGDTSDWFQLIDTKSASDGRNAHFLIKSFNMTEYGITDETDIEFYFDSDVTVGTQLSLRMQVFSGEYHRYNSTFFPDNDPSGPVLSKAASGNWQSGATGNSVFNPGLSRTSVNWDEIKAQSDFATLFFTWDEVNKAGNVDFKNFTLTNSTTWNMQNALVNYTAIKECDLGTSGDVDGFTNSADHCDSGSARFVSSPHIEFKQPVNQTSDWQYREREDSTPSTEVPFFDFTTNATGLLITSSQAPTNNEPGESGEANFFKTFTPTNASTTISAVVEGEIGVETAGMTISMVVCDESLDRWNGTQFEGSVTNGICTTVDSSGTVATVPFGETTISFDADTSSVIGEEVTALFFIKDASNADDGTITFKQTTIGVSTYNFTNPTIKPEIENTRGGDRGLVSPSETTVLEVPPDQPQNLTATADIADVLLEWIGNSTTDEDYRIERGAGFNITSLTFNRELDLSSGPCSHTSPESVGFSPDGEIMIWLGSSFLEPSKLYQMSLSDPWNVTSATCTNADVDLSSIDVSGQAIFLKPDGTRMWFSGSGNNTLWQLDFSTPFDITTLSLDDSLDLGSSFASGITFSRDGSELYFNDQAFDLVLKYEMTTKYDISTATLVDTHYIGTNTIVPRDIDFSTDGLNMVLIDTAGGPDSIDRYILSQPFNISTALYNSTVDISAENGNPEGFFLRTDNQKLYIAALESTDDEINEYDLTLDFSIIVPSLADKFNTVFFDDFSTYPDNATGDTFWVQSPTGCTAGSGGTNNYCGVNATSDTLVSKWSISGGNVIYYDVFANHGINITDSSGNGNFSLTWKHLEDPLDAITGIQYLMMVSDDTTNAAGSQDCVTFRFIGRNSPGNIQSVLIVRDDNNCNSGFEDIDSSVEDGDDDLGNQRYVNVTKAGNDVTTQYFTCEEMTLACRISTMSYTLSGEVLSDLRYIKVGGLASGSSSDDYIFDYDDIQLSVNGQLVTSYRDTNVELGTTYTYRVTSLNNTIPSPPSNEATVITNNLPAQVLGLTASFVDINQIDLDWSALPFDSGVGDPSTGLNLTSYKIFRENVTAVTPYELAGQVFASSPPPNFFNDTSVSFPDEFNYQVSGCNVLGCGNNSTVASATVNDPPSSVETYNGTLGSGILATSDQGDVVLDWPDALFALNYTVTRAENNVTHVIIAQGVTTSEYIDFGVPLNTNFTYGAWGVNNNGNGTTGYSNPVITNDIPTAPQNLTGAMGLVIPDLEDVFLDWEQELDNGTGSPSTGVPVINYTIERKQGLGAFGFLANVTGGTFEYEDETVVAGANYTYRVKGVNIIGESPYSNTFSIIATPLTPPDAPTDLTANTLSGSQIQLDWLAAVAGDPPTDYVIQQRHVGFTGFVTITTVPAPTLTYTATGLLPGNTYDYRVRADNGAGSSSYSNIAQNTTFTTPTAPQNLIANTINDTAIFINWDAPSQPNGDIQNYTLDIESPIGGGFSFLATINGNITEFTSTGLTTKTQYNYRVLATNLIGSGPYSNQAANTTFGVPDAPINLGYDTNGVSTITVNWDAPLNDYGSAITGYRIDQAEGIGGTFVTAIANTGNNVEPLEETFVGLLQQTNYIYRIAAINGFGLGPFSANLTAGTFAGASEPENFFAVFNATKPYSVFLSWEEPLNDGGLPIAGYLVERKNESGVFILIANLTSPTLLNYTDTGLLNLSEHEYRVAAYSNPIGSFTPGQTVVTFVPANIVNFTINDFDVAGDVLQQQYSFVVDDCFPTCTLTQADIERNGLVESNYVLSEPVPLDTTINFTTWFIIPTTGTQSINTTAIVTNLGGQGDDEVGVVTTEVEFLVAETLFFNHTRTSDFEFTNFTLIRHPVPWDAECTTRENSFSIKQTVSLQGVGFFDDQLDATPSINLYVSCEDPVGTQILAFTSFGTGNGTLALTAFTNQLGDFMGVPVPYIFIIILAAIWTGRSAPTGIIILAVAIGSMGLLGYFDPVSGSPVEGSLAFFWGFIVFLTLLGVFIGKRYF